MHAFRDVGAVCTCMAGQLAFTETYQERHKVPWYTRGEIKILRLQGFRQFGELWRPVSPTKEDGQHTWPRENNLTFSSRLIKMNTCRALISQQESVMCCTVLHDGKHVNIHFKLRSFNLERIHSASIYAFLFFLLLVKMLLYKVLTHDPLHWFPKFPWLLLIQCIKTIRWTPLELQEAKQNSHLISLLTKNLKSFQSAIVNTSANKTRVSSNIIKSDRRLKMWSSNCKISFTISSKRVSVSTKPERPSGF